MTNEPLFRSVAVAMLPVKDVKRAEAWYVEKLGLAKSWEAPEWKVVSFGLGESSLAISETPDRAAGAAGAWPMLRPRDLDGAHATLRARGVDVEPIEAGGGVRWFRFRDLDGNLLEALETPDAAAPADHA